MGDGSDASDGTDGGDDRAANDDSSWIPAASNGCACAGTTLEEARPPHGDSAWRKPSTGDRLLVQQPRTER
ncbi:hypothetical protein C487_10669 [Natrinema pallidum DSM 3751]|uniref:Uncharacterized protein n=1 Tax=Natrinema pallidum DSM 3751 TaxID=1227495 RepID=L9YTF2_9EURY|nr:hypothetical protein C487_10669 [Natrinema pallidum DSM 3751]